MQARLGNGAIVSGTATKDAEYKTVGDKGTPLSSFSLAVNARGEDGVFVNCKAFGVVMAEYARGIKKGDAVCAVGAIETREYNGKTYKDLNCQWLNCVSKSEQTTSPREQPPDDFYSSDEELPF